MCFLGTLKVGARNITALTSALVSKSERPFSPFVLPTGKGGNWAPPAQITDDGLQGLRRVLGEKKGRTGWPCVIEAFEGWCGLPWWLSGKELNCQCRRHKRRRFDPCVRKIPWRKVWQPTPVFLPGESLGQRSLVGYSPWGHKESDTTE